MRGFLAIYRRDSLELGTRVSIDAENEYFRMVRSRWGDALRQAFTDMPDPEWPAAPAPRSAK